MADEAGPRGVDGARARGPQSATRTYIPASRRTVVYWETEEEKLRLDAAARATCRSTSAYARLKLLGLADEAAEALDRARRAEAQADQWSRHFMDLKKSHDVIQGRAQELEEQTRLLRRKLDEAERRSEDAREIHLVDPRMLAILMTLEADGTVGAVFERDIMLRLDVAEDPAYGLYVRRSLAWLVEKGLVENLTIQGKPAYKWRGRIA